MNTRIILAVAALGLLGASDPGEVVIEVEAGPHDRRDTPVVFPLPEGSAPARAYALEALDDKRPVAVQLLPGERPAVAWMLDELPAGKSRRYRLSPSTKPGEESVTCTDDGRALTLGVGGREVLRYNHAVVEPPAGLEPTYRRSGFLHPLRTPSGRVVTDDFAPDHAHQHGLFFAWVNATFRGHRVDFWNQLDKKGRIRHAEILERTGGPVFAQFRARLIHEDTTGAEPDPVLDEIWTVRAYNLADRFLVDFESRQTTAGDEPLVINKYHYGGLGLRGNSAWFDPMAKGEAPPEPARSGRSDFLTSEGKGRADGNHTRPRWAGLSGLLDGQFAGLTILDHPGNFRAPQPVRLHPNKPYLCFAPMVLGGFEITPGRPYVSRYRLVLHDGAPDAAALDRLWRDYADPPRMRSATGRRE